MHSQWLQVLAISTSVIGASAVAHAQQSTPVDVGKFEYESHCAVCHGLNGEGNGPYTSILKKNIPGLTTLSKSNGGVFPFPRVYETIDGRQQVQEHGPKDMPIWGREFTSLGSFNIWYDPEAFARAKILALTDYIYRLQAK